MRDSKWARNDDKQKIVGVVLQEMDQFWYLGHVMDSEIAVEKPGRK